MHDLSLHLLDLMENALQAGANQIHITIEVDVNVNKIMIRVEDDGPGFVAPPERVIEPFYTTQRKRTGLGLSLLHQAVLAAGGTMTLSRSETLGGASVWFSLLSNHIDRPPFGDLAASISTTVMANPEIDLVLTMKAGDRQYHFHYSEFLRRRHLQREANIAVARAVRDEIGQVVQEWKQAGLLDCPFEGYQKLWMTGPNREKEESVHAKHQ